MRKPVLAWLAVALALNLAACGGQQQEEEQESAPAVEEAPTAEPAAGTTSGENAAAAAVPAAFFQCRSCHATEPGRQMIGPSLAGIFGTKAGDVAGYNFSPAMKQANIVWDEKTLDAFLKDPHQVVPGTKMTFPGLKDDARRAEVVAYLKSLGT
jgi:cytochrome c2